MKSEKRWQQRFHNFEQAMGKLTDAVQQESYSDLERVGLIKTTDFSFELAWKTLKDLLEYEGYEVKTPRMVLKQAFKSEYIQDGNKWLDLLDKRNFLAHVYDDVFSKEVVLLIKEQYYPLLKDLYEFLKQERLK